MVAPMIVSDRIVDILKSEGFSGWDTYPVELYGRDGSRIPGYQGLAVRGRCGVVDRERSVPFKKVMPGGVFTWWRGLYFDPATWDGSDIFVASERGGWIFVLDEVKRALLDAGVKNLQFTPLDDVERMTR